MALFSCDIYLLLEMMALFSCDICLLLEMMALFSCDIFLLLEMMAQERGEIEDAETKERSDVPAGM